MFAWGNCQTGDRLVMERHLGRSPTNEEMGDGFILGVRFYFRYDRLEVHPNAVHDGFLPIKILDEVVLAEHAYAVIIPLAHEFFHTIEEQLGGKLEAGFRITHIKEDVDIDGGLAEHNVPSFLLTRAVKE